jgi:hypothetical protein
MSANRELKIKEYSTLQEKSVKFFPSNQYANNCIQTFAELDDWFSHWKDYEKGQKYKAYFRGMGEAKHKLYSSAQRLWSNYEIRDWKRPGPQLQYQDFVMKLINESLNDNTLLAKVFKLYGIEGTHKEFPCLSILQHYGSPTPLLDWTYNFRVALFFATEYATVPAASIANELDDYFAIYVITEQTFRIKEIEKRERALDPFPDPLEIEKQKSVLNSFPDPLERAHPGHLSLLTDIKLDVTGKYNPADPFKKPLMATIYNQYIIPQEGLFIFNPHAEVPLEDLFSKESLNAIPKGAVVPNSSFMVYNIHKRLLEYVKRKIAMEGYTRDYIMPDLKTFASSIKEKVLNGLV